LLFEGFASTVTVTAEVFADLLAAMV